MNFLYSQEEASTKNYIYTNDANINKKIQRWLNVYAYSNLIVDGILGSKTKKALIRALQHFLNCEYAACLNVDGIFGPFTQTATLKVTIKPNDIGNSVSILKGLLYVNGLNPNGFNQVYNNDLSNIIRYIQNINNFIVDGICHSNIIIILANFNQGGKI